MGRHNRNRQREEARRCDPKQSGGDSEVSRPEGACSKARIAGSGIQIMAAIASQIAMYRAPMRVSYCSNSIVALPRDASPYAETLNRKLLPAWIECMMRRVRLARRRGRPERRERNLDHRSIAQHGSIRNDAPDYSNQRSTYRDRNRARIKFRVT